MRDRTEVLRDLIKVKGDIEELEIELNHFPWDSEELVTLSKNNVIDILNKVKQKKISLKELETWANIVEMRDDIAFKTEEVLDMIYKLANPFLYDPSRGLKNIVEELLL